MQNQLKPQNTQQLSTPLDQQNCVIKSKIEEQSKSMGARKCVNGEKYDKIDTLIPEIIDEKPMRSNDHHNKMIMEEKNGYGNGGVVGPRERLKRHRTEVAGNVWIPDLWGKEDYLKDWIDYSVFDKCLVPQGIMSARASLIEEGRKAHSGSIRVQNSC